MTSTTIDRRALLSAAAGLGAVSFVGLPAMAQGKVVLRLSAPATATDQRAIGLIEKFGPAIKDFAEFQPHWNATLFKQGTENEAIARGNLEMSIASAQEFATIIPAWSIFTAGYLLRDADHQLKVFKSDVGQQMAKMVEDKLGIKLLAVMYLGKRQVNLRTDKQIKTPADHGRPEAAHAAVRSLAVPRQGAGRQPAADGLHRTLHRPADRRDRRPGQPAADQQGLQVLRGHQADRADEPPRRLELPHPLQEGLGQVHAGPAGGRAEGRRRRLRAGAQGAAEARGRTRSPSSRRRASRSTSPTSPPSARTCRRNISASKFAKDWPAGMVDKINAIK